MYDAITIAKYAIRYSSSKGVLVNNIRLQKVLYFIQAEFATSIGIPCFKDKIEAWDLGPVVPSVYRKYKIFGASSIPVDKDTNVEIKIANADIAAINDIIDQCNKHSTSALVEITQKQEPWIKAFNSLSREISPKSLRDFFKEEQNES